MDATKTCFKCNETKTLSEFYPHKQMADGHLNKCKECTKKDVNERARDPEARKRIAAYERQRFQNPLRKQRLLEYQRKRRQINPIKDKARNAVGNAIRDRRLTRLPCEVCGDPKSQAHHTDYTRPLDVQWLCFKHHREIGHGQITNH